MIGKRATIVKVKNSDNPEFTGHISIGISYEGTIRYMPEIGECFYLDDGERCLRTSPIVNIIDSEIFETLNSIYKLTILE